MKSTISEKGQVTIPKSIRNRLGFKKGTVLDFRLENGKLVVEKRPETSPFCKWRGRASLPSEKSVDAYLSRIRDADGR